MEFENHKTPNSPKIFSEIAPTYQLINSLMSFGLDQHWRKQMIHNLPSQKNLLVLDIATGTADVALLLAESDSVLEVFGLDPSLGMLEKGKKNVSKYINKTHSAKKIELSLGDAQSLPFEDESFNATTISYGIRNVPDPQKALFEMYRVLKPGGRSLILETTIPKHPLAKMIYLIYFRNILPFIGKMISGHPFAYKELNKTTEVFPSGIEFTKAMEKAGFKNVSFKELTFGVATLYSGDKI